jgi:hypothetical protein
MARKWVGWTVCLVLLVASVGASGNPVEYRERFWDHDNAPWIDVSGKMDINSTHGANGRLIDYLRLEGDGSGDLSFARAHVDPSVVDTDLHAYEVIAILERDAGYGNAGWFGITFAETGDDEYYVAGFDDDEFFLAAVSGGNLMKFYEEDTSEHGIDHDSRLRYAVQVQGATVSVAINGFPLTTAMLPTTANGYFGLAADTGTAIHAQEVLYRVFDDIPPLVEIFRPQNNTFYLADQAIDGLTTGGTAIVIGALTIAADILDGGAGVKNALLLVNGQYLPGSITTQAGQETVWTIDTSGLPFGFNEITVRATDNSGNLAQETVRILVISDNIGGSTIDALDETVGNLIP